jgi:hypothetical protein
MSKKKPQFDERQLNIFELLRPDTTPQPGSMDIDVRVRHTVSEAIKASGKDRIDICAAIYKLTGIEVPVSTLNGWSAESRSKSTDTIDYNGNKRWGIPSEIVPAFCYVTDHYGLLHIQVEPCRFKALKGKDVVRARMGLLKEEIAKKAQEIKSLEKALLKN